MARDVAAVAEVEELVRLIAAGHDDDSDRAEWVRSAAVILERLCTNPMAATIILEAFGDLADELEAIGIGV